MLIAAAVVGCGGTARHPKAAEGSAVRQVSVTTVSAWPATAVRRLIGTVTARNRAEIEPRVQARIEHIGVTLGSRVRTGDLLAELDSRDLQARLQQVRALRDRTVADLERAEGLLPDQAITQREFDAAKAGAMTAEAAVREAEAAVSYARLAAPFAGVVTQKSADVGDLAVPGRSLFVIEEEAPLRFDVAVPESEIGKLSVGDSADIEIANARGILRGRLDELSQGADIAGRSYQARFALPPMPELRPGQFGRLLLSSVERALLRLPAVAVIQRGQLELVYVVGADNRASLRLVRTGRRVGDEVEILSGLTAGEQIVIIGQQQLVDGAQVQIQ